jgi:type IV fimbrial biogenesis protein FimT
MRFNAARFRPTQLGVTLVELMITITIAGILLGMGVSSYKYVTKSNRSSGEINALLGDMQFARYEAVKEGLPVQICPTSTTTSITCSTTTTWSNGWIVLSNAGSGSTGAAVVLRRQLPFSSFNSTDTLSSPTAAQLVTFNREGFASGITAVAMFSLHDATASAAYTRCLMLGVSGTLATARATSQSGQSVLGTSCT